MDVSFIIVVFLFIIAMVGGFIGLKYMERRLGLIRSTIQDEQKEGSISSPPTFRRMDDIDYIVDWFVRRDPKINNPLLLKMSIVDNLVEETKIEFDDFATKKHKFNRYLGELVDFLPKVGQAEEVFKEYYGDNAGEGHKEEYLINIRSYIIAKIRVLGWLYHSIYKRWYNQRDCEFLDFQEYFTTEDDLEKIQNS